MDKDKLISKFNRAILLTKASENLRHPVTMAGSITLSIDEMVAIRDMLADAEEE